MIEQSAQKNINLFNKFSKIDYSTPKKYLEYAYGKPVEYYSKEDILAKEKRKKIYKTSAFVASAISIIAITAAVVKGRVHSGKFKITLPKNPEDIKLFEKVSNCMANIVNIKDDYWDKFIKNDKLKAIPFFCCLEKIANKLTGLYKNMVKASLRANYEKAYKKAVDSGASPKILQSYDDMFSKIDNGIKKGLHQKGNRVTDNLINDSFFERMFNGSIANEKIIPYIHDAAPKTEIEQSWSDNLKQAVNIFNKQKEKTFNILTPKLRDINCGSAPTDFLTIFISSTGLAIAVANADSKEDKKSISINLGIPLIVTLLSTTYGNIKAYSGAKSMIFGLTTGQIASNLAKAADEIIKNKKEKTQSNS